MRSKEPGARSARIDLFIIIFIINSCIGGEVLVDDQWRFDTVTKVWYFLGGSKLQQSPPNTNVCLKKKNRGGGGQREENRWRIVT